MNKKQDIAEATKNEMTLNMEIQSRSTTAETTVKSRFAQVFSNAKLARGGHEDIMNSHASFGVVHVFEERSRTDLACLRAAYEMNGLPAPSKKISLPKKTESGVLFLSRQPKSINADIERLGRLIAWQRKNDYPVALLPQAVFYGSKPGRTGPERWWDKWTGPEDRPKLLRKLLRILRENGGAVAQAGEPIILREFLSRLEIASLSDAAAARMLLDTLRRDFQNLRRSVLGPPVKPRDVMKEKVRRNPLLINAVEEKAKTAALSEWQVWQEVDRHLNSIMADYDVRFIRLWAWILKWVWNKFFDGVSVDRVGLERARRVSQKTPVIYVPCHKSHADYLLVSYILFINHMTPPHIAAGANLNFWPLGFLFRHSGAFFLRRSFRNTGLYPEVFESYLRTLMQERFDVEVFIEGGRSRTGKPFLPKMGLLSMMIHAFEEGEVPDLNMVPISISYDRVPEEKELLGETQLARLLPPGWRGVWELLRRDNGKIHLNFAPPVSLREYLVSRNAIPAQMEAEPRRAMYRDFAFRLIRAINEVTVVTPNAVAAAAIMARQTPAVEEAQVQIDAALLLRFLKIARAPIAPTMRHPESAIAQALKLNRAQNLVQNLKLPGGDSDPTIISIDPEKRPYLELYKNNILHWLYPAAFVAAILLKKEGAISIDDIANEYRDLMLLLKYELVFDNERHVEPIISDVLGFFMDEGFIESNEKDSSYFVSKIGKRPLFLFSGQIENFFESYKLAFEKGLPGEGENEHNFAKKMVHDGLKAYHLGNITRREAVSLVTFKNALALMNHLSKIGRPELSNPAILNCYLKS